MRIVNRLPVGGFFDRITRSEMGSLLPLVLSWMLVGVACAVFGTEKTCLLLRSVK